MKLLIVSYIYKPKISPRAFRWAAIAEEWAQAGHQVDVVSAWHKGLLREEIIEGVDIHRVGFSRQYGNTLPIVYSFSADNKKIDIKKLIFKRFFCIAKALYNFSWKKLYWPDQACLWIIPSYNKAKKLYKKSNHDCIITVSHPFSAHVTGLFFKKNFRNVPWLVDIGDPFSFLEDTPVNNFKLYKKINRKAEKRVFDGADIVTVTTEPTKHKYIEMFPDSRSKVYVLPPLLNVFNISNLYNTVSSYKHNDRILNLVYMGTLYGKIRSPEYLLKIFYELLKNERGIKLNLHFVGSISDCEIFFKKYQNLINKYIFLHGRVSRSKALEEIRNADILVNIGNSTNYQLPSKIVEYIYAGKPILNLVNNAKSDSSTLFLKNYPAVLTVEECNSVLEEKRLEEIFAFIETAKPISRADVESLVSKYKSNYIAQDYLDLLIEIV